MECHNNSHNCSLQPFIAERVGEKKPRHHVNGKYCHGNKRSAARVMCNSHRTKLYGKLCWFALNLLKN